MKHAKFSSKNKNILLICTGTIAVSFEVLSLCVGYPVQRYVIQTFRLWTWIFYFLLGNEMHSIKQWFSEHVSIMIHLILFAIYTIAILGFQIYIGTNLITEGSNRLYAEYFYDSLLEMVWIILLFSIMLRINISHRLKALLNITAPLTLGVYIIHPLVLRLLSKIVGNESLIANLSTWFITLICSMMLARILGQSRFAKYLLII